MQTTLRIHDALYREAKAQAARAGISLTKFIEDALRQKIEGEGATLREATPAYEASSLAEEDRKAMNTVLREFEEEEEGAEEAWADEIKARLDVIRSGKAKGRPLDEFMRELGRLLES